MPNQDTLRAIGIGMQPEATTEATTIHWLDWDIAFALKPLIVKEFPKFKVNSRMEQRRGFVKTNMSQLTLAGAVDSRDSGYLLTSAYGFPTSAAPLHTFLAGRSGTGLAYLTIYILEGIPGVYHAMIGACVDVHTIMVGVESAYVGYEATLVAPPAIKRTSSVPVPAYTLPVDQTPFQPWSSVVSLNGSAIHIFSLKSTINNHREPVFSTPLVAPSSSAQAGLTPERFKEGSIEMTGSVLLEYTNRATEPYDDMLRNTEEAWIVSATEEVTTGLGYTPRFKLTLPKNQGSDGEIDRSKIEVPQSINWTTLYAPGITSVAKVELTGEATSYAANA